MGVPHNSESGPVPSAVLDPISVGSTVAPKPSMDEESIALDALYGQGAASRIRDAKCLVVGAGGVGCEVLKNIAFAGFRTATVIDLDTIDVSNLNRQFLFRRESVGKPKAETAASAIRSMQPAISIEGIVANIKDPRFGVNYFKSFNIVCNALDNLDARRHVNRMCLAAKIPLIESGSTGYNGNCSVHSPDVECYDCNTRPAAKSYAVCTIRSTPEKPVHCIVWAKSLWDLIFGPDDDGNLLADLDGGGNAPKTSENHSPDGVHIRDGSQPASAKSPAKRVRYCHQEPAHEFADRVCARVFVDDIAEQAAMKEMWTTRKPPTTFDLTSVCGKDQTDLSKINLLEQRVWDRDECARIFRAVLIHMVESRLKEIGTISFDKDDSDALAFVVAAANLRADAYGVPCSSPFSVKGIAGNIVHAVATTNAIVGGLVVLEALKVIASEGSIEKSRNTYVTRKLVGSRSRKLLNSEPLSKPKPNCFVCSKGQLILTIDTEKSTLKMLIDYVLLKKLSVLEPSVYVSSGSFYNLLYECGAGLEEDEISDYSANKEKTLAELRATSGSQLSIEDLHQNLKCVLHVSHKAGCEEDKPVEDRFLLEGAAPVASTSNGSLVTGVYSDPNLNKEKVHDLDEIEVVEDTVGETRKVKHVAPEKAILIDRLNTEKKKSDDIAVINLVDNKVSVNGTGNSRESDELSRKRKIDGEADTGNSPKRSKENPTDEAGTM